MSAQIISLRSIALTASFLLWGAGIGVPANTARAADCLGAPTSGPPQGSHWYYRTDRATDRKCWHLGGVSPPAQDTAAQEDETAAPAVTPADTAEEPATASAGAQKETETSKTDSRTPLPPPRPQPAMSTSGATTREPVRQPAQEENAAPATPAPAPQPAPSRQTNAFEPDARPAAPVVWPDPPAVATVQEQKPNPVPSNASPYAVPSTVGARPDDDPVGAAQTDVPTGEAAKTTAPSAGTLAEILLVVALALTAASLLYRLVAKITAARDRRILMDHSALDWAQDDRQPHQFGVERRQRGFVDERQKFVDDLRLSLVPNTDDPGARRQIAPQSKGHGEGVDPRIAGEFSGRENRWAQLLRDLDQIMQSRKEA
jgi:hypothetical protein